jgi:hypothetical protein
MPKAKKKVSKPVSCGEQKGEVVCKLVKGHGGQHVADSILGGEVEWTKKEPSAAQVLAEAAELAKPAVDAYKNKVAHQMVEELEAKILCNHRNLHAQPEALCIFAPGHSGNHSDGKSEWSDAAGTPPRKHA